jgi:uncharacterized protein (DUF169 family)
MHDTIRKLSESIEKCCKPATYPVAVRLARQGEDAPFRTRYPLKDIGNRLAVCQGMTMARTLGWTVAFGAGDHACPFPAVFMGHIPPDGFLEGETASYYVEENDCARRMEAAYPRWEPERYHEVWLAPLARAEFEPDAVVVYGNPAQMVLLIQAANCSSGTGVSSFSFGRAGCAGWLAGVIQSGTCTYMVPGPGERVFAGTQDHEMSFAIPASRFEEVTRGLEYVRKQGMFRYPVPNLQVLKEPVFPEKYADIAPRS